MKNMTETDVLRIAERQAAKISTGPSQERIVMELAAIGFAPKSILVYHKESGTMVRAKVSPTDRMQALKALGEHLGCFSKPEPSMQQGSRLEYKEGMSADEAHKSLLSYLRQQNRRK
jgi:hypothetical protein